MRRCCWERNRALMSSGRLGLLTTSQRRTALDATLLTFCPPGPPERTKLQSNSSSGIRIVSLISSIGHPSAGRNSHETATYTVATPPLARGSSTTTNLLSAVGQGQRQRAAGFGTPAT